jgi:hypothetical protein
MSPSSPDKQPKTNSDVKQITACFLIALSAIASAPAAAKPWAGRGGNWPQNVNRNAPIVL